MTRKAAVLLLAFAAASCQQADEPAAEHKQQPTAKIPAAFQGLWLADENACNGTEWSEGYSLAADAIRMSKSGAPLKVSAVQLLAPAEIIVSTDDPSAGWSSDGKFRFVLDRTGKVLSNVYDERTASFDYLKCETN